jgi:hypothetical protein
MLPLKINETTYNLPLAWDEVTLAQAERLLKSEPDLISQAAALLGIDKETLLNANTFDVAFNIGIHLEYLTKAPEFDMPPQVFAWGKWHDIPQGFDDFTYGQVALFQNTCAENLTEDSIGLACFGKLIAIAMCKKVFGKVTENNIELLQKEFAGMKYVEAQPLVLFFCQNLKKSMNVNKPTLAPTTRLRKWRELVSYLNLNSTRN